MIEELNWTIQEDKEKKKKASATTKDTKYTLEQIPETVEIKGQEIEIYVIQISTTERKAICHIATEKYMAEAKFTQYRNSIKTHQEAEHQLEIGK